MAEPNKGDFSFATSGWQQEQFKPKELTLQETLRRINIERGPFRNIREADLDAEIEAEGAAAAAAAVTEGEEKNADVTDEKNGDEDDEELGQGQPMKKPETREELFQFKNNMLKHVISAQNDILMALDFVSLLQSGAAPQQAQRTISPVLQQVVPLGTLGVDMWEGMKADPAREEEDRKLAFTKRMGALKHSADLLLGAAKRLDQTTKKEKAYWDQVLNVQAKGYAVTRISPGRLGVRYGFTEAEGEYAKRGIAAFKTDEQGKISLQHSEVNKPMCLHLKLMRGDELLGISGIPKLPEENDDVEIQIKAARDSLFDEELYHEMIRESRKIEVGSMGVTSSCNGIIIPAATDKSRDMSTRLIVNLAPVTATSHDQPAKYEQDNLMQALLLAARLLLSQAHRNHYKDRTKIPPPMSENPPPKEPYVLLRPIVTFLFHRSTMKSLNSYLDRTAALLNLASIRAEVKHAVFEVPLAPPVTDAASLIHMLWQPLRASAKLVLKIPPKVPKEISFNVFSTLSEPSYGSEIISNDSRYKPILADMKIMARRIDAMIGKVFADGMVPPGIYDDWQVNQGDAVLRTKNGLAAWVGVDSTAGRLSISSIGRREQWELDGSAKNPGKFWAVADSFTHGCSLSHQLQG